MKIKSIKKMQKTCAGNREKKKKRLEILKTARLFKKSMRCIEEHWADRLEKYSMEGSGCYWKLPVGYKGSLWTHFKRLPASLLKNVMDRVHIKKTVERGGRETDIRNAWKSHNGLNEQKFAEEVCLTNPTNPFFGGRVDGVVFTKKKKVLVEFKGVTTEQFIVGNEFAEQTPAIMQIAFYSYITGWKDVILVFGVKENDVIVVKTRYFTARSLKVLEKDILTLRHGLWIEAFTKDILIWKILGANNIQYSRFSVELKKKLRGESEWLIPEVLKIQKGADSSKGYKNIIFPKLEKTSILYEDFEL